ncbi:T9SS type A sorting domain-containing protein [Chryseobacterium taklimakanense]|uniref:T9SS-dependent choice-of-anchor J family protein n=1 Tax=Chryseobacterium taklimakanense TaxID=536441 RepID=UPI001EF6EB78|nr:T9SS type A sorting domain-containing protein [Chryseobacterium taklimakanense]MCG7281920.1 T9SS type A sorting domain-containing protein [Chryseobacterium taklimakanense]
MKNIFIGVLVFFSGLAFSQELAWEETFDGITGWQLLNISGNEITWQQGANRYYDAGTSSVVEGTAKVLRFDGKKYYDDNVDSWAISPAIDLTGASGTITLAVSWNKKDSRNNYGHGRVVYISENPSLDNFQNLLSAGGFEYSFINQDLNTGEQLPIPSGNDFYETEIDISAFAGKKIYIGLHSGDDATFGDFQSSAINIDNMAIYAEKLLATNEVKAGKSLTKVMQNPVGNSLMLHLNPAMAAAKTAVQVYSAAGQQVLNAKYAKELNVSALAPGMYLARVSDGTLTETVKFIKK